jgi:hypothetical protein
MENYRVVSPKYIKVAVNNVKKRKFVEAVSTINKMLEKGAENGYAGIQFYFWDYFQNLDYTDFENIKTMFENAGYSVGQGKRKYDLYIAINCFIDRYVFK